MIDGEPLRVELERRRNDTRALEVSQVGTRRPSRCGREGGIFQQPKSEATRVMLTSARERSSSEFEAVKEDWVVLKSSRVW